ncbi:MAG TPA: phosphatase PAP2 family protein [Candidatus Paceibacterota bacterium]
MSVDSAVFQAIFGLAHRVPIFDFLGVFFARYLPYLLIAGFLIGIFFERGWKLRFHAFASGVLSVILSNGIIVELIRFLYYRPRPALVLAIEPLIATPVVSSFPSGHAAAFFALAVTVFFLSRRLGIWFLAVAALVAVARVFVGVHWPFDIIAGALVGVASALAVNKILPKNSEKH